ncbi:unnamed protein product [Didymodactylos carnosus]|uniref:SAMD1-like winged helix (WH) domain-containing protein n=1 Tax=Didymodactylos carnosus TaxID=1234261 RepID=A0A814KGD2_9BILA|nr:unnamed protein product [Didymodactylos carnosus]CAF1049074.1 unnamed protein product [Didymodactylos carnosus]CAF3550365.1 unnamed protein product [Didymodactylos carnosus]CAF3818725.1 unnamed protein product [Didymodactylos carnosus]
MMIYSMSHYIVQPATTTLTATTTTLFNNQQQESKHSRAQSPSFIRKKTLKQLVSQQQQRQQLLHQNDVKDLRSDLQIDSSSSSSTFSSASSSSSSSNNSLPTSTSTTVITCDLLNIITDQRFKPVFEAIDEIKKRKCRPDLDRIIKYVTKRNNNYLRNDILMIIDELLKLGLVTKIFHKGGFTIRIKNDKCAKLIERMNNCNIQKPVISLPSSIHLIDNTNQQPQQQQILMQTITPTQLVLNSNEENTHTSNLIVIEQKPNMKENKINSDDKFLLPLPPSVPPSSTPISSLQTMISTKRTRNSKKNTKVKKQKLTQSSSHSDTVLKSSSTSTYQQLSSSSVLTIELILGLNGEIPDVHSWSTDDLIKFFKLNGYDYASQIFKKYRITGNSFYSLNREFIFKKSTLKVGKALKLWNVIQQIQQNQSLHVS